MRDTTNDRADSSSSDARRPPASHPWDAVEHAPVNPKTSAAIMVAFALLAVTVVIFGGNLLNPRRFPPVLRPTVRGDRPNFIYQVRNDNPDATDVINDDVAILHLQYSTQWDSLAHVGQLFDADGDGKPEPVFYNGYRAGIDLADHTREPAHARGACCRGLHCASVGGQRREHGSLPTG